MSTRYVWEKWSIDSSTVYQKEEISLSQTTYVKFSKAYTADSYTFDGTNLFITDYREILPNGRAQKYAIRSIDVISKTATKVIGSEIYGAKNGLLETTNEMLSCPAGMTMIRVLESTSEIKGTTRYGYVASESWLYPSDGVDGSYWYVYKGSDTIDPTAISIPASPKGGQPVTISATPRVNTYGGTIFYQIQVRLDGGAWTNVGGKTTATSVSYTVPKGTKTLQARVQTSDDMGFTSTDWVTSNTVNVKTSPTYAIVNGVIRNPESRACVSGVIRETTSVCCVGGVIKT